MRNYENLTGEDIKSWTKMTWELLRRGWWLWLIYFAVVGIVMTGGLFIPPASEQFVKIATVLFLTMVGLPIMEFSILMAQKSDTGMPWKEVWSNFKFRFSSNRNRSDLIVWGFVCALGLMSSAMPWEFQESLAKGMPEFAALEAATFLNRLAIGPLFLIAVPMSALNHHFRVGMQLDMEDYAYEYSGASAFAKQYPKEMFWKPLGLMLLVVMLPLIGALFIPWFVTWLYVAVREMTIGGGNKKVEKKVRVSAFDALPQPT